MAVQVIRAKRQAAQVAASTSIEKLKVAAYCRVSTDSDEQETSYEAQCTHYTNFIQNNPEWELAGIFADEGISGTMAKKRPEFLRMIAECEAGNINMVVTKSISRFARNTLDCLTYIRKLKALGIAILFEKENINTLDAKGEVLITIMASIAQQESQSISQNVRIGIQYQMQQGHGRLNTSVFMGLKKGDAPDTLVIIPEEAAIVRRIYRQFLEGYSPAMICRNLEADGIMTKSGGTTWYPSTITGMLENEKYSGDVLLQKYFTVDFLTKKVEKNTGQFPQYFVENHHEPIIPKLVYYQVQGELMRRGALKNDPTKLRFGKEMALSGRLICGKCGRVLKRYTKPDENATDWRCRNRAYNKKTNTRDCRSVCGCRFVRETDAKCAIVEAFNRLHEYRDELIRKQGQIWAGEIKRIDALIERSKEAERSMEERRALLETETPEESAGEIAFLLQQIAKEQEGRNALILERAEHANSEIHVRLLLELVDTMKERREESLTLYRSAYSGVTEPEMAEETNGEEDAETPAACYDYDEFFRRTKYELPEDVLDSTGTVVKFDNSMVIRYLDSVTIHDDRYDVNFKAGFTVTVK